MKTTVILAAAALASSLAFAAPPTDASVARLLEVSKAESTLDSAFANLDQHLRQSARMATAGRALSTEQQGIVERALAKLAAVVREEMGWSTMRPEMIAIYRESFDQEEIDGLIAFYESPAGKAFVAKMPTVLQKSMVMSQSMMQRLLPRIQQVMTDAMQEAGIKR